jgi:hypothetical protein
MRSGFGLLVFSILAAVSTASNPQVDAINAKIKALKVERSTTLHNVHTFYTKFIRRDRFTEEILAAERQVLLAQEEQLLAVTSNPKIRKNIVAHYESLRAYLRIGGALGEVEIARLKLLRAAHEDYVRNNYDAQIAFLQTQAKAAAAAKSPTKK